MTITKNTSIMLIAAIVGILAVGTLAVGLPNTAFASQNANGGIGNAGGAGGVGGNGGLNFGGVNGATNGPPGLAGATCVNPNVEQHNPNC
ncbi:MAG TPA: hypothetical protein VGE97_05470 [Nitrososphaera sp.]|jgi:hypothetical protein